MTFDKKKTHFKKMQKSQNSKVFVFVENRKTFLCELDSYDYITNDFNFLAFLKKHSEFPCRSLRSGMAQSQNMRKLKHSHITDLYKKISFVSKCNLKALNDISNINYIGKHFFKSLLASKLKTSGVKYIIE